jgi:hypothetical protein
MTHYTEEELMAYRDGDVKKRDAIRVHLAECPQCREEMQKIEAVFAALDAMPVPDPGEDYGRRVWQQIAPRLTEKRSLWWSGLFSPGRLAAVGVVAALVILAFVIGRTTKHDVPVAGITDAGSIRERVLMAAVADHLSRSEMVLMELANGQPQGGNKLINISAEQKRAEDLVEENRLYRQSAWQEGDVAMANTLDELERVLVDVANSPDEVTAAQFASIQRRIDSRSILLKVRVVQEQLRDRREKWNGMPAQNEPVVQERSKI